MTDSPQVMTSAVCIHVAGRCSCCARCGDDDIYLFLLAVCDPVLGDNGELVSENWFSLNTFILLKKEKKALWQVQTF